MGISETPFDEAGSSEHGGDLESRELKAEPIARERMDLLWTDGEQLEVLLLAADTGSEVFMGLEQGGPKKLSVSREDVEWAISVDKVAAKAADASSRGDFEAAIRHYREALRLAPGADIYLMSIGACYANMGRPRKALPYLRRAHEISPGNPRIQKNLRALQARLGA